MGTVNLLADIQNVKMFLDRKYGRIYRECNFPVN
jgi:hypothetical protein